MLFLDNFKFLRIVKKYDGNRYVKHFTCWNNSPFDESCLKAVFRVYQMDYPYYEFHDTLSMARRTMKGLENHQLHNVAAAYDYQLDHHHHALSDAEACAWIAREIL